MEKNNTIRVEGTVNERRIVREIIDKYVDKGVMANIDFIPIIDIHMDENGKVINDGVMQHDYAVNYEFRSSKRVFKKIMNEVKFIGVKIYKTNSRAYSVVIS